MRPMGWQSLVADRGLEHVGGRLCHREVDVSVDRQAGKSTLILGLAVRKMLACPGSWVTYTSASRLAARRKLLRRWWPLIQASPLADRFRVVKATGGEALECTNGSLLLLLSVAEESGHGEDAVSLAFLDECWSLSDDAEAAVRPTMATQADAQMWCFSTAGVNKSRFWWDKVQNGRAQAELGVAEGVSFTEWAAGKGMDVTDEATWASFMPALHRTISIDTVRADLAAMTPATWRRCYANQWPSEAEIGWRVISKADWEATRLE